MKLKLVNFFSLITFLFLACSLNTNYLKTFDTKIINFIQSFESDFLTTFLKTLTKIGNTKTVIVLTIIVFLFLLLKKYTHYGIYFVLNMISSWVIIDGVKYLVKRERPTMHRLISEKNFSFPSGHATATFIFWTLIIIFIVLTLNNIFKYIITILIISLIFIVGVSRIYLGVHFPSDILAGYLAGSFVVSLSYLILNKIYKNKEYIKRK